MFSVTNISKRFGQKRALEAVSLSLQDGQIFGLLGSNGAGKSTLMRCAAGIWKPNQGAAALDGAPVWDSPAVKAEICYITDDPAFLHGATIRDMDRMQRAYYPKHDPKRLAELCERFSLPMNEMIAGFSKGMQKRVQVSLALARHPRILLCDETFDGLDPVMREIFKRALSEAALDDGTATVLAGHDQQELEDICDSIGFMHQGKLLRTGELDTILTDIVKYQFVLEQDFDAAAFAALAPLHCRIQGHMAVLTARGNAEETEAFLQTFKPLYLERIPLSLEEIFILEMEEQGYAK